MLGFDANDIVLSTGGMSFNVDMLISNIKSPLAKRMPHECSSSVFNRFSIDPDTGLLRGVSEGFQGVLGRICDSRKSRVWGRFQNG